MDDFIYALCKDQSGVLDLFLTLNASSAACINFALRIIVTSTEACSYQKRRAWEGLLQQACFPSD